MYRNGPPVEKMLKRCWASGVVAEIQMTLDKHLRHLKLYDFLWKDDMRGNFTEFMTSSPHTTQLQSEVQRMCDIQNAVTNIPMVSQGSKVKQCKRRVFPRNIPYRARPKGPFQFFSTLWDFFSGKNFFPKGSPFNFLMFCDKMDVENLQRVHPFSFFSALWDFFSKKFFS